MRAAGRICHFMSTITLLPSWADPAKFSRLNHSAYLAFVRRGGDRCVRVVFEGRTVVVPCDGGNDPWAAIRTHLRAYRDRRPVGRTRRRAEAVTYEYIYSRWHFAKRRAEAKQMPFSISVNDLYALGDKQRWRCALTRLSFDCSGKQPRSNPYALSIDRINSRDGYTVENVRLVLHSVNCALGPWGEDVLAKICEHFLAQRCQ